MEQPTSAFEIRIEGLPKLPNELKGMHWAARSNHTKQWRCTTVALAIAKRNSLNFFFKPFQACRITFVRASASPADLDGIVASMKPLLDGIVDAGIILGDGPGCVMDIKAEWHDAPKKKGYVKIIVEPMQFTYPTQHG